MALENVDGMPACVLPGLSHDVQRALHLCIQAKDRLEGLAVLASTLGFDGLSYLVLNGGMSTDCVSLHLTTAGRNWSASYARRHYHSIDPRIVGTHGRHVPIIWSAAHETTDWCIRSFLDHASRFRICSGVAISLRDARVGRVVVAWDSATSAADGEPQSALEPMLGTLTLLAGFLHEALLSHYLPDIGRGARSALSERERSCLVLAANGMTSLDIGVKLGITERTVNFHFGNIIAKLGVLNRGEAIARAVAHNIVSLEQ